MGWLDDRVAIITGGASSIGAGTVRRFIEEGAKVLIADMALFLASDESQWITGQAHMVDGGFSAGIPFSKWPEPTRNVRPIRHHRPEDR